MKSINIIHVLLIFLLIKLSSCEEEQILPSDIIKFEIPQEESIPADNFTSLMITAVIPKEADINNRSIKFKTDNGYFSNDTNEITIEADPNGNAATFIRSNKSGRATITASISSYKANKIVNFQPIDLSKMIRFENFDITPLAADALTDRLLKVIVDNKIPADKRKVTFTTDIGTFTNQTATIDILANQDGIAQTFIKSDIVGKAKIKAIFNSFETENYLQLIAPTPDNIVLFGEGLSINTWADGTSTIELKAIINNNITGSQRNVKFTTDLGSFPNGTKTEEVTPDASGTARTLLKSTVVGKPFVTITCRTITRSKSFEFTRAVPDKIAITLGLTLKAGLNQNLTIPGKLTRLIGIPSPNFEIDYTAVDTLGQPIGYFSNSIDSDSNGQTKIEYSAGSVLYRGKVFITASVKEVPTVKTTGFIYIVD